MNQITPDEFFALKTKFAFIPFTQSRNWYNYMISKGENMVFFVDNILDPQIGIMGKEKKIPILGKVLFIEGELISDNINNEIITAFYRDIIKLRYTGFEINSIHKYSVEYEIGLRRAGFIRPISLISCPLSIIVDLNNELKYNKNWKSNIKKAKKAQLKFSRIEKPTLDDLLSFKLMYDEMAKLKNLKHTLNPKSLFKLLEGEDVRLYSVVDNNGSSVAKRIVYINKDLGSDIYAANSNEARTNGASFYLMQSLFDELHSEGIKYFDLCRIPPSNHATDSIYIFKNSVKGIKVQYNGEWTFYHSNLKEYIMHIAKKFVAHMPRY
jgi:lipid II:glycine glycyltransferase (peptidoglycan interpeptide bridge formation enzyme)